jgi:hypothetical protein
MSQPSGILGKKKVWIIRAGRQAEILDDFLEKKLVAIGWPQLNDLPLKEDWEPFRTVKFVTALEMLLISRRGQQLDSCGLSCMK